MAGISSARDTGASYVSYGNSIVTSPWGDIISRFDETESSTVTEINLNETERIRRQLPLLKGLRTDVYELVYKKGK
ncbi:hypothetical protein SDC9_188848 [bioreactor metagenome]|uniref:CN hydrolase domain-containing protein n=1 Tax=bioreactor metagenome TaxID=1076179 RepID=A0A645HQG6_9ZZZZ